MSDIYIPLPKKDKISLYLEQNINGFIVGIKGFSSNFNYLYTLEELKEVLEDIKHLKVFVFLDRLFYDNEIDEVKDLVEELVKLDITGIGYTDIGVLNILNSIKHNKDIFWISNHLGTNSKTINFLEKRNVNYALLSTEITIDEIINIKKNTNIKIGTVLYGFLNMATSSRKLLTNYFKYINKEKNKDKYTIEDKISKNRYTLVEKDNTNFYTGLVLNGIKYFPRLIDNNIDFIILDDYMLDENNFYNVIEAYSSLRNARDDKEFVDKLEKVVNSNTYYETFNGFLDKETVFKVADYEKN